MKSPPIIDLTLSQPTVLGIVAPEFVSATIDWWTPSKDNGVWEHSSILNADLSNPKLIEAARGLRPYFLRIGGSQADLIIYNFPGTNSTAEEELLLEKECKHNINHCLTRSRWDQVLNFAEITGARIVFTLAYLRHTRLPGTTGDTYDKQDWDSSNARRFLEYNARLSEHGKLGTLFGVELGNELRHKSKAKNVTRMVQAYEELRRIVDGAWDGIDDSFKPRLMGPACTGSSEFAALIKSIGPHIDIATYHKYHGKGGNSRLGSTSTRPSFYAHPADFASQSSSARQYLTRSNTTTSYDDSLDSYQPILWIGEGAMAYDSGQQGVTNTFISTSWYAALLSSLSKTQPISHSVYCRQALIGGYYELISHETMDPNPDYWMARLWKQLVGRKAIGPIHSSVRMDTVETAKRTAFGCCKKPGEDELLVHAFCAKIGEDSINGDAVFVVINVSKSTTFSLNITLGSSRTEYILTPQNDQWSSKRVMLNGKGLSIRHDGTLGVQIQGVHFDSHKLVKVPPKSVSFVVIHGAGLKQCSETGSKDVSTANPVTFSSHDTTALDTFKSSAANKALDTIIVTRTNATNTIKVAKAKQQHDHHSENDIGNNGDSLSLGHTDGRIKQPHPADSLDVNSSLFQETAPLSFALSMVFLAIAVVLRNIARFRYR